MVGMPQKHCVKFGGQQFLVCEPKIVGFVSNNKNAENLMLCWVFLWFPIDVEETSDR